MDVTGGTGDTFSLPPRDVMVENSQYKFFDAVIVPKTSPFLDYALKKTDVDSSPPMLPRSLSVVDQPFVNDTRQNIQLHIRCSRSVQMA